jgi:predicted nucleic acid-binding protein
VILVDTSVWRDHLRGGEPALAVLLKARSALTHPIIVTELALMELRRREIILDALMGLPTVRVATQDQVLDTIRDFALTGLGLSYSDIHLLAATRLTTGAALWTRSPALREIATQLGRAFTPRPHGDQLDQALVET